MPLHRFLALASLLLGTACAETPRCVERNGQIQLECNAGKTAVCGTRIYSAERASGTYDPNTGGLVRVPPVVDGVRLSCGDFPGFPRTPCRELPSCEGEGSTPTCPGEDGPLCVLGMEETLLAPVVVPPPDAGPADAGVDAGVDAGL